MATAAERISFPETLPISRSREALAALIGARQVIIVAGETGSGKTTQLPKLCLQLGRGERAMIGHTQPRRIAARAVAARIAQELGQPLGASVAYQVRFADQSSEGTRLKLMTDGILLAEIQRDRLLRKYDTLIIDEAHERSLNIDFLLGYLKWILPRRADLKLIIASATIDVASFSRHFDDAPAIEVSGRAYPVSARYLEPEGEPGQQVPQVVRDIARGQYGAPGDILVFLSGEREIRELAGSLRRLGLAGLEILPLYARLPAAQQARALAPRRGRGLRVVLATNVAETSLTVPGIRYVIDPGYARVSRYSYRTRIQRLPVEAISQASADQRMGRCGRVAEGVCLRLYSERDFAARPQFTEPEMRRTNLAAVILRMLQLGLGDVERFPFIDPPDSRQTRDGKTLLRELGAIDRRTRLTELGRGMASLPVDPRFARMLLAAAGSGCLRETLVIVSGLSVQDPREWPAERRQAAAEQHRRFRHPRSDFMDWLALWDYAERQRQDLSRNQWRRRCQREFLSHRRLLEWRDLHFQLALACRRLGLPRNREAADYDCIHKALLTGLLGNLGQWREGAEYRGARGSALHIFPGSSQFKPRPKWLMAAEIVATSRNYARCVAAVRPEWALSVNPELLRYHYYEPRWESRAGRVTAARRISLYGLVLEDRRRVHYGPINPEVARELLVREGLVPGRVYRPPAFLRHNLGQAEALRELESKLRRRDVLVDEEAQAQFYLRRLPAAVTTIGHLGAWLRRERSAESLLRMSREDLALRDVDAELGGQFPDSLAWSDFELRLSYRFEPGHPRDGVSVTLPIALLNRAPRHLFEWLVPGLLREKCIAMVKALPKARRKLLAPVPDHVDRALGAMAPEDRPLGLVLAQRLRETAGVEIDPELLAGAELDSHYRMHIAVVAGAGEVLAEGRDFGQLLAACRAARAAGELPPEPGSPARQDLREWPEGDVPPLWRCRQAGILVERYPALEDAGEAVNLALFDYPDEAAIAHRRGLLRLMRMRCAEQLRPLRRQLLRDNASSLLLAGAGLRREALVDGLIDAAVARAMFGEGQAPRTREEFERCRDAGRARLRELAGECESVLLRSLEPLAAGRGRLASLERERAAGLAADVRRQWALLFEPGFLRDTPWQWLRHYPRYTAASAQRIARYPGQEHRDGRHGALLERLAAPWLALRERDPDCALRNPELRRYRWMLEEFRVSLWAQGLGTSMAVSEKRLLAQWQRALACRREHPASAPAR